MEAGPALFPSALPEGRLDMERLIMTHGTVATTANLEAIDAAYQSWRSDPQSVDPSWRFFFEGFEPGASRPAAPAAPAECAAAVGVVQLIETYRDLGHFL